MNYLALHGCPCKITTQSTFRSVVLWAWLIYVHFWSNITNNYNTKSLTNPITKQTVVSITCLRDARYGRKCLSAGPYLFCFLGLLKIKQISVIYFMPLQQEIHAIFIKLTQCFTETPVKISHVEGDKHLHISEIHYTNSRLINGTGIGPGCITANSLT